MASLVKRSTTFYIQYYVGGKLKRRSLNTDNYQIAKEKVRQFESAQLRGDDSPLPTRTPLGQIIDRYVQHIRNFKTAKSAQTDIYYLRQMFGPVCDGLKVTSRKLSPKAMKRPAKPGQDRRFKVSTIEVNYLEDITTAAISGFMSSHVASRGLAPKTANRYREIICRVFNWAMAEGGIKMPGQVNPATKVSKYKEHAPKIRFLTLTQIDEQLKALESHPQIQTMAAMYIYAGLRREELLWLTLDDIDLKAGQYGMLRIQAKTING